MVGSHLVSEDLSDKELLNGFRNPDTRNYFFNLLIRKYEKKIYYHIRRLVISHDDANDVTQDIIKRRLATKPITINFFI